MNDKSEVYKVRLKNYGGRDWYVIEENIRGVVMSLPASDFPSSSAALAHYFEIDAKDSQWRVSCV